MLKLIRNFARDDSGATAVEYSILLTAIGIASIAALTTLGSTVEAVWQQIFLAVS